MPRQAQVCNSCGFLIPVIEKFSSQQRIIRIGKAIILEWAVSGAEKVFIQPGVGEVEATGWIDVYPMADTRYTLSAISGPVQKDAVLDLSLPAPKIQYFSAAETVINLRYPVILHWEVENAETIHIDRGIGEVSGTSFMEVQLSEPGTYTLTAANASGSVSETLELTLPMPEITVFAANNEVIRPGTASVLMWEVENAEKVFLEPEPGEVTGEIRCEVFPEKTTTYTLIAENHSGRVSQPLTLVLPLPNILFFEASDQLSTEGKAVEFYWKAENAYKIEINQGVGDVTGLNKIRVKPQSAYAQYVLTATGHSGTKRRSLSLSVFPVPLEESLLIPIPEMDTDLELKNLERENAPRKNPFNPSRMEDLEYIQEVELPEVFFSLEKPSLRKELKEIMLLLKETFTNKSDFTNKPQL